MVYTKVKKKYLEEVSVPMFIAIDLTGLSTNQWIKKTWYKYIYACTHTHKYIHLCIIFHCVWMSLEALKNQREDDQILHGIISIKKKKSWAHIQRVGKWLPGAGWWEIGKLVKVTDFVIKWIWLRTWCIMTIVGNDVTYNWNLLRE